MTATTPPSRPLTVLLAMVFLYQADATIVNVAAPSIRADLGASGAELELVISGYLVASATLIVTGARLGHLYGHGRVFLVGVGVFGAASLACGVAPDPTVLVAARVVQGIGGALAFPQVLTGIQLQFDAGPARMRALGRYAIALSCGAVSGQLAGGLLVSADLFGWQWRPIFLINVPITIGVLVAGSRVLRTQVVDSSTRLDLPGAATLSAAVLAVVLPLSLGRDMGWPAWTWLTLVSSAALFAAFVAVERRRPAALLDLALVRRPAIAWGVVSQSLAVATYWALLLTLALYLQGGLGRSALVSGLTLLPWVIAFAIPGRLLGRVPDRLRPLVPCAGCVVLVAAYAALSLSMFTGIRSAPVLMVLLAIGGFGLGTMFSSMLVHLTSAAGTRRAADISGTSATSMQVTGAVAVAAFGSLYLAQLAGTGAAPASHAFGTVTAGCALVAAVAALMAYRATHSRSCPPATALSPRRERTTPGGKRNHTLICKDSFAELCWRTWPTNASSRSMLRR